MKKTLMFILVALIAVTCIFAEVQNSSEASSKAGSAQATVSFSLPESAVAFNRIGFSNQNASDITTGTPVALGTITLNLNEDNTVASKDVAGYIYYYYKAATKPVLRIKAGTGLSRTDSTKKIGYSVTVAGNTPATSGGDAVVINTKDLDTNGTCNGYISFGIETTSTFTPDMASDTYDWTDTITLSVAAV